ncbi:hypothetical protein UPYG_G00284940 [Umbra pygmaea]|uniref:Secreted phosphoprotein 1 n=1 Tax=Umbra pygmaea TaxID=75934 RepID=A0ABD0W4S7_UMBPY
MKAALVFVLLFASVLCRPMKRVYSSSSESSEEMWKPAPVLRKAWRVLTDGAPLQETNPTPEPTTNSPGNTSDSDESEESEESTASPISTDSDDSDESSESVKAGTTAATTTVEPTGEPTLAPTQVPNFDNGRGDSTYYSSDYKKSIIYADTNNIEKGLSPYKSYKKMDKEMYAGKKASIYNTGNEIDKTLPMFKALRVHDLMEEDTSTPEVESQGLDVSSGPVEEPILRQAHVDDVSQDNAPSESLNEEDAETASAGDTTNESSKSSNGTSGSASAETDSGYSSEETKAMPGVEDSDSTESAESQESNSDEETATKATVATDTSVVITAK